MKAVQNFGMMYILMVVGQMFICNYFHLSMYVSLTILPAIILCIPLSVGTITVMFVAFASGLAVDALSDAVLGLNAMSLVPVALCRRPVIRLFLGNEIIERKESFSFRQNGFMKIAAMAVICLTVFLVIYITADGAGVRPLWFNAARFAASLACSWILSLFVINILTSAD